MNLKKQKLKIPDGWQEVKSDFEKNYSYYVSPNGIIYDLLPESQLLVSRVDGSTIPIEFEQSIDEIYCKYQEIKKTLPDVVLMYEMKKDLYIFGTDGEQVAETIGLPKEDDTLIDGEKICVCRFPIEKESIYTAMLNDRGWNLAVSKPYDFDLGEQSERYIKKTVGRETPVQSWPAGRIDYLYSGGVGYSAEYTTADFANKVMDSLDCGEPIYITQYTNDSGKTFVKCVHNCREVSPYLSNIKMAEAYKDVNDFCLKQGIKTKEISCGAKKSVREQLNAYRQCREPSDNVVKSQVKNRESLER